MRRADMQCICDKNYEIFEIFEIFEIQLTILNGKMIIKRH